MEVVEHCFAPKDLVAGHLALDLVNTVTARNGAPKDWLSGYGALLDWARLAGRFPEADLQRLAGRAGDEPQEAEAALRRLKALRELLHRVFQDRSRGGEPAGDGLRQLQEHWREAAASAVLSPAPTWSAATSGLDLFRHQIAWEAVDLLEKQDPERIRVCDGPDCGWLFLDTSKNNRRRWCDMKVCGNVVKARRHLAKVRAHAG